MHNFVKRLQNSFQSYIKQNPCDDENYTCLLRIIVSKMPKKLFNEEKSQVIEEIENYQQFQKFSVALAWCAIEKGLVTTLEHPKLSDFIQIRLFEKQKESIRKLKIQYAKIYEKYCNEEKLDKKILSSKYYEICFCRAIDGPYPKRIWINFEEDDAVKISQSLKKYKHPRCQAISLYSVNKKSEVVKSLLRRFFPQQVKEFKFCLSSSPHLQDACSEESNFKKMNIGRYLKELAQVLPKVTHQVAFGYFEISQKQFKKLLYLCRDKEKIIFDQCKIHLHEIPSLSKAFKECKIKTIDFYRCGVSELGDWKNNLLHFDNLINGLSQSRNLQNSLNKIWLYGSYVSKENIRKVFEKYPFKKAIVTPPYY
ncbi:unnamed protein product [Moneuplotes crassus]|uniref:Uncharacterized protein n=1 Tax=Euplotes crassus TaxID=5936 RepID=A0AAD2D922_EUPCR|nr:unnamed protein product [Moneuplotes crassus]